MYSALLVGNPGSNLSYLKNCALEGPVEWVEKASHREANAILNGPMSFDLVLIDAQANVVHALDLLRKLKQQERFANLLIFIVGAQDDLAMKLEALKLGAEDFFTTAKSAAEICCRIECRMKARQRDRGGLIQSGEIVLETRLHWAAVKETGGFKKIHLTSKEFKILSILAQRPGKAVSRKEICDVVWGSDIHVSERTIDSHIFGLRKKLGPNGKRIQTLRTFGFRFAAPSSSGEARQDQEFLNS